MIPYDQSSRNAKQYISNRNINAVATLKYKNKLFYKKEKWNCVTVLNCKAKLKIQQVIFFCYFFYIIAFLYQNIKVKNNNHHFLHIKAQLFC